MTDNRDFHAWAERIVAESEVDPVALPTLSGLPLVKGQSVPKVRLILGDTAYDLTNVTCTRGLEQGMSELEGDVDGITETEVEFVELKPRASRSSLDAFEFSGDFEFLKLEEG